MHAPGDNSGPSGLVARSEAGPVVAMEVLVEEQQIAPVRVFLELRGPSIDRPPPFIVAQKDAASAGV